MPTIEDRVVVLENRLQVVETRVSILKHRIRRHLHVIMYLMSRTSNKLSHFSFPKFYKKYPQSEENVKVMLDLDYTDSGE